MRIEKINKIGKKLEVFGFGKLQDLVTLCDILQREGIALKDMKKYVEEKKKLNLKRMAEERKIFEERKKEWNKKTRRCPTCMSPLFLRPITVPKGKGNVEGYTCLWYCSNETCLFEEYTKDNFIELYNSIMKRGRR